MATKGTTYVIRPRKKKPAGTALKQRGSRRGAPGRKPAKQRAKHVPWRSIAVAVAIVAAGGLWTWSARGPDVAHAKDKAIDYFATHVHQADPSWLSLFGYMHRRFGIVVPLASGQLADDISAAVGRPEVFQIYRRIEDPRAAVGKLQIAALPTPIDRITASALHCDRIPLPSDWIDVLRKASVSGGYALTHSVLAAEWTVENGCLSRAAVETLRADQIVWLVTFVQRRHDLRSKFDAITDMWVEAVAMLYYVGAGDMVRPEWIEEIVNIQNDDGGWSRNPQDKRSDPHATALALWVLLEQLQPAARRVPWIQQS